MAESTNRQPEPDRDRPDNAQPPEPIVDVLENLVYKGGYTKDPREIVENPAVTPEMLNEPGDLRRDLLEED